MYNLFFTIDYIDNHKSLDFLFTQKYYLYRYMPYL